MTTIYTKTGDSGKTSLLGGTRVHKYDERVEFYGTMDEAISVMGIAYAGINDMELKSILRYIQKKIFLVNAEIASDNESKKYLKELISQDDILNMERIIDNYCDILGAQTSFIIPGDTKISAVIHLARTIVRRGERGIVLLSEKIEVREEILKFINRLSDLLFVMARMEVHLSNSEADNNGYGSKLN